MATLVDKRLDLSDALAGIQTVLDYWKDRCQEGRLAHKADIHPWELQDHLGRICLLEIRESPLDFIYRLDGSNIASATSTDMTGLPVSKVEPEEYGQCVHRHLSRTLAEQAPTLWHIEINYPPATYRYQRIVLPLLSSQDDIRFMMTCSHCLDTDDGVFPWHRSYGKPE